MSYARAGAGPDPRIGAAARVARVCAVYLAAVVASACGGPSSPPAAPADERAGSFAIVATERGARGGYLVFVGSDGARTANVTRADGHETVLDRSPAFSPDGRWIAFASTRGRESLAETSLWIVAAEPGAEPRRLTSGAAVDRDPAWTPDGRSIVFSSNRGGDFDLYAVPLTGLSRGDLEVAGPPVVVEDIGAHALAPAVSPDGERVAYMALSESTQVMSMWLLDLETQRRRRLTEGPRDMTPAWSPAGDAIAFAAMAPGDEVLDLYAIDPEGGERQKLATEPYADQSGPVFSADGRYVFATSVYRSVATGEPVLSSVVFVDRDDPEAVVRALHDPVAVESRVGVTVSSAPFAAAEMRKNPPYVDALREAVERELRREQRARERRQDSP